MQPTHTRRMTTRVARAFLMLVFGLATGSCGQTGANDHPAGAATSARLPPGYALRLDRENRAAADFVVAATEGGMEVHTGPAGILYRPEQVIEATTFGVHAAFTEVDAPEGHREGFGLFVGGRDLESTSQQYVYFMVRGDGHYLIKQRDGDATRDVSDGWQFSTAVRVATDHDVVNALAIAVDRMGVHFLCNGHTVATIPGGRLHTQGIVGVRVNHNLRVRIQDFRVDS